MFEDVRVGFLTAVSSIKRGNKKTSVFIVFVLALIFMNLIFLPSLINGMMGLFVGFVQDYAYGNVVIEPREGEFYINNVENVLKKVRSLSEVKGAAKRLETGASLKYKDKIVGASIIGLVPSAEEKVSNYPNIVKYGEFLGEMSRDEILIGSMIAGKGTGSEIYDNLGDVEVGSLINVTYSNGVERTYKVRGIHEGTFELTDLNALVHYKELEDVFGVEGEGKATSVIVKVNEGVEESKVKRKILDMGVKEKVYTWQEKAEVLIRQALQSIGSIGIVSKVVGLIVGASLIFIIIYINTLNRKKEIGILRAIGVTPNSIRISYVLISLFYVISGIIIGVLLFFIISFYLKAHPLTFYESIKVYPEIDMVSLMDNILITIGMAIIAGFIPAWFVTRQDLLEAIWGR